MDYTEDEIRELANVKLEKFIDPKGVRSGLLEQYRRVSTPEPPAPNYAFGEDTLYETHRGPIRWLRALFRPFLKLLFNPNPLIQALHIQADLNQRNAERTARREQLDALHYEVIHNLVVELTRTGVEVKALKMRLESMASRLDFDERRARALEGVVQYRAGAVPPQQPPAHQEQGRRDQGPGPGTKGPGTERPAPAAGTHGSRRLRTGGRRPQVPVPRSRGRRSLGPRSLESRPAPRAGSARRSERAGRGRQRAPRAPAPPPRTAASGRSTSMARARAPDGEARRRRRRAEAGARSDARSGRRPSDVGRSGSRRRSRRPAPTAQRRGDSGADRRRNEARRRRPALRRGHQRRRGAARALHRRTSVAPRLRRGRDDLRARLRDVEERASRRCRTGERHHGPPLPGRARARSRTTSGGAPSRCSTSGTRSPTRSAGSRARDRRAPRW